MPTTTTRKNRKKTTSTKKKAAGTRRTKAVKAKPAKLNPEIASPFDSSGVQHPEPLPEPDAPATPAIEEISSGIADTGPFKAPVEHVGPPPAEAEGKFNISRQVLARIAGLATWEVPGLAPPRRDPISRFTGAIQGRTDGIRVDVGTTEAAVDMLIRVRYGTDIPALASRLRESVSRRIWEMTGLRVVEVNVRVQDVIPAAQLEPQP